MPEPAACREQRHANCSWDLELGIWDLGVLVPVRGYEKGCSAENLEFAGIAA